MQAAVSSTQIGSSCNEVLHAIASCEAFNFTLSSAAAHRSSNQFQLARPTLFMMRVLIMAPFKMPAYHSIAPGFGVVREDFQLQTDIGVLSALRSYAPLILSFRDYYLISIRKRSCAAEEAKQIRCNAAHILSDLNPLKVAAKWQHQPLHSRRLAHAKVQVCLWLCTGVQNRDQNGSEKKVWVYFGLSLQSR
jgi:hypothetical protein